MDFSQEIWDNAVSNVAYFFSVKRDVLEHCLKIILQEEDISPSQTFWFLRSLATNGNISNRPFDEEPSPIHINRILRYYLKCHDFIREPGDWIGYKNMWADLKTKHALNANLKYKGTVSGYDVFWKSKSVQDFYFWDYLLYPIHHTQLKDVDICKAVWVNWVMSLEEEQISKMNLHLHGLVQDLFVWAPEYIGVYKKIGKNNPDFYRMCMMTNFGINYLISRYSESLDLSKSFFEKNGFVFSTNVPKMPYGFDFMAAQLNISCYAKPVGLWK
jgi:hypothetical protein